MTRSDNPDKKIGDRVDALSDKSSSPVNTRNTLILGTALALGGGYYATTASGAAEPARASLDVAAQANAAAAPRARLFVDQATPLPPIETGPSDLEIQMATLMGAVESLGTRIDAVATAPPAPTVDPAAEALLEELRNLAQSNEAMREDLKDRIEKAENDRREAALNRNALEMQIAELRAEILSGQGFGSPAPFADDNGTDPAAEIARAEAERLQELYDRDRVRELIDNGGVEPGHDEQ